MKDKACPSFFLFLPLEIRILIYQHLLDNGDDRVLAVRHLPKGISPFPGGLGVPRIRRTWYRVADRSAAYAQCMTTYRLTKRPGACQPPDINTAIMATCRQAYLEMAPILYGWYTFDFGNHTEAIVPFFSDRTAYSRSLVRSISIRATCLHWASYGTVAERREWADMVQYLNSHGSVRALRLVVDGGLPSDKWEGPQELNEADINTMCMTNLDGLAWVKDLAKLQGLRYLEIVPHVARCSAPTTTAMMILVALSASIEHGLADFLRRQMRIPARLNAGG